MTMQPKSTAPDLIWYIDTHDAPNQYLRGADVDYPQELKIQATLHSWAPCTKPYADRTTWDYDRYETPDYNHPLRTSTGLNGVYLCSLTATFRRYQRYDTWTNYEWGIVLPQDTNLRADDLRNLTKWVASLERKLQAADESDGTCKSFGQLLIRLGRAAGIGHVATYNTTEQMQFDGGAPYRLRSLRDGSEHMDYIIRQWQYAHPAPVKVAEVAIA